MTIDTSLVTVYRCFRVASLDTQDGCTTRCRREVPVGVGGHHGELQEPRHLGDRPGQLRLDLRGWKLV